MISGNWHGRRVFVTGHTGFKGGWLSLWLWRWGAQLRGYSLPAPTVPSLFQSARIHELIDHVEGDVRDLKGLSDSIASFEPEVVFHLAAQSLVRPSYDDPVETYGTNVMGTVNLLEAVRHCPSVKAIVVVTTDKCYENREWIWGYRENEPMGGHDPYSSSKGCAELVTSAYRRSFFDQSAMTTGHSVAVASARAGNVIGGGDWAQDRLIPDAIRSFEAGDPLVIRSPRATRPWQHVVEPLGAYLTLAERLLETSGSQFAEAWNFGPKETVPVESVVDQLARNWGGEASWHLDKNVNPHEAHLLHLDISKAKAQLGWQPQLKLDLALQWVVDWYRRRCDGQDARELTLEQIDAYTRLNSKQNSSVPAENSES